MLILFISANPLSSRSSRYPLSVSRVWSHGSTTISVVLEPKRPYCTTSAPMYCAWISCFGSQPVWRVWWSLHSRCTAYPQEQMRAFGELEQAVPSTEHLSLLRSPQCMFQSQSRISLALANDFLSGSLCVSCTVRESFAIVRMMSRSSESTGAGRSSAMAASIQGTAGTARKH